MRNSPELLTIRDYIRFATSLFNENVLFYGHGTESAWDEAIALVLHTLHLPHQILPHILDANLTQDEKERLYDLISRRIKERIPVPYLTHEAWFAGLPFYVDERVLIPRSPIAELIENQFEPWVDPLNLTNILDLCTGSGCIAIACASYLPDAMVDACDISDDALTVAKMNALRHHIEDHVTFYKSDLFKNIPPKKYDLIVSNPPYVDAIEMAELPQEFHHEPKLALAGGQEGLDIVTDILAQAHAYLNPKGILIVEVGNSEAALIKKFPDMPFTWLEFERGGGGVFLLTKEQL